MRWVSLRINDEKCFNFEEDIKSEQFWYLNEIGTVKSSWKFVNLGGSDCLERFFTYFNRSKRESFSYSYQIHHYWLHAAENPSIPSFISLIINLRHHQHYYNFEKNFFHSRFTSPPGLQFNIFLLWVFLHLHKIR